MVMSVGEGISRGLTEGMQVGINAINVRERSEDRKTLLAQREQERQDRITQQNESNVDKSLARDRLAKQDERQVQQDERALAKDELSIVDGEYKAFQTEAQAAIKNFGGFQNVPPEYKQQMIAKQREIDSRLKAAREKFANPRVAADQKAAEEYFARVKAGQVDFNSASPHDIYKHVTYMCKRPPEDFIRPDDKNPSKIEQACMDVEAGITSGNNDLIVKGANTLYQPELSKGIGELRADGSRIVSKEISQLVPHPDDPTKFVPILKVTVERQDGAKGVYEAPVTQNRSSDPNDLPKVIDMDEALDDMGRKASIAAAFNTPEMKKKLLDGAKTARPEVDEFLASMSAAGVSVPTKKIKRERMNLGNEYQIDEVDAETGEVLKTTYEPIGARPKAGGAGGGDGESSVGITGPRERATVEATASGLGVPVAKTQPGANLTPKERDKLLAKMRLSAEKKIETADEGLGDAKAAAEQAKRFVEILNKEPVQQGVIMGRGPALTENAQIMDEIRDFLTPRMRVPGSGATSDFDARMFQGATLGRQKGVEQNKAIAQGIIARAELLEQRQQFMRDYLETNDHLEGSEREWKNYLNANPIFTKDSSPGSLKLNDKRQSYQEFFGGNVKAAPTAPEGKPAQKSSGTSPAPAQTPGINVQSKTPPKEFRAKGRDALYDFQRAQETVQNNPSAKEEVRKRLISAGYPAAAVNAAIK